VRIIAGTAKGMKLSAPPGHGTRPVLDRVKESWFSSIGERVEGARVLDLYCGVGSLGLEALSREADSCVFVESDPECVKMLEAHLAKTRLVDRAEVRRADSDVALDDLSRSGDRFDLIFLDPPFRIARETVFRGPAATLERAAGLLAPDGIAMLRRETGKRGRSGDAPPDAAPPGTTLQARRRWGRNEVIFYKRSPGNGGASSQGASHC